LHAGTIAAPDFRCLSRGSGASLGVIAAEGGNIFVDRIRPLLIKFVALIRRAAQPIASWGCD